MGRAADRENTGADEKKKIRKGEGNGEREELNLKRFQTGMPSSMRKTSEMIGFLVEKEFFWSEKQCHASSPLENEFLRCEISVKA